MSACPDCTTAAEHAHHGFRAGCIGCCARAAARSPQYRKARDSGVQHRDYRRLLEQFGLSHQQVRDAAAADAMGRVEA
jgi:hypothetical protein